MRFFLNMKNSIFEYSVDVFLELLKIFTNRNYNCVLLFVWKSNFNKYEFKNPSKGSISY